MSVVSKLNASLATLLAFLSPGVPITKGHIRRVMTEYYTRKPHSDFARNLYFFALRNPQLQDHFDGFPSTVAAIEFGD
jgi:hypothetical protein